jgi:hypothetical protein
VSGREDNPRYDLMDSARLPDMLLVMEHIDSNLQYSTGFTRCLTTEDKVSHAHYSRFRRKTMDDLTRQSGNGHSGSKSARGGIRPQLDVNAKESSCRISKPDASDTVCPLCHGTLRTFLPGFPRVRFSRAQNRI